MNAVVPNFNLVNQSSLDQILKVEVFVHSDGQLCTAHMILCYDPISKAFQAPKCVTKAKDPRLHQINVAALGFFTTGPVPEGIHVTTPILEGIPKVGALPSHPVIKEEKEEEEERIVEVSNFEDDFDVFNQPLSLEAPVGDPGDPSLYKQIMLKKRFPSHQTCESKENKGPACWR